MVGTGEEPRVTAGDGGHPPPTPYAPDPDSTAGGSISAATLFGEHFRGLCRTAYLVVGDSSLAEEIVMEAFARTIPRWAAVQRADRPVAYVRRAVVNLCMSRLRRLTLERRVARATSGREPVRWDADLALESRAVIDAVRALPDRQRACIVLRYFDDLPEHEIGDALGCSVGTVKSQLSKARARLAVLLDTEREEHDR